MHLPHSVFFVGMLWAVVVGSSLYSADLGSGLGSFWRSRAISPGLWFWSKFVIGLVAVVGVLDGVTPSLLEFSTRYNHVRNELGLRRLFTNHPRANVRPGGTRNVLAPQV